MPMREKRYVTTVGSDGQIHLDVGKNPGTKVEVIVCEPRMPLPEENHLESPQNQSGLLQNILGKSEEDIWNDL